MSFRILSVGIRGPRSEVEDVDVGCGTYPQASQRVQHVDRRGCPGRRRGPAQHRHPGQPPRGGGGGRTRRRRLGSTRSPRRSLHQRKVRWRALWTIAVQYVGGAKSVPGTPLKLLSVERLTSRRCDGIEKNKNSLSGGLYNEMEV